MNIEHPLVGVVVCNREKRWTEVNPSLCEMLGYGHDELLAANSQAVLPADDLHTNHQLTDKILREEIPSAFLSNRLIKKNGEYLYAQVSIQAIRDQPGKTTSLLLLFVDVSEQTRASERFQLYFEHPLFGAAISEPRHYWTQVNDKFCELCGYSRQELSNLTWKELTHPDDWEKTFENYYAMESGQVDGYSNQKRIIHKNGSIVDVEQFTQCARKDDGALDYYLMLLVDISERQHIKQDAEAMLQRFQDFAETSSDWFWEMDTDFRFCRFDVRKGLDASLLGNDRVLGKTRWELANADPDQDEYWRQHRRQLQAHKEFKDFHYEIEIDGLGPRNISVSGKPIYSPKGEFVGYRGTALDVTEATKAKLELIRHRDQLEDVIEERTHQLKAAQDSLLRKERLAALGQLTAAVSHELRNPLATLKASLVFLDRKLDDLSPEAERAMERVNRSVDRCENIIEDLLEHTRLQPLLLEKVDMSAWLHSVLDYYEIPSWLSLKRDLPTELLAKFDTESIRRALMNLLDNAAQALSTIDIADKKMITIAAREVGSYAEFSVADNGPGMDEETRKMIFEPLYTTKTYGVGLGLPIVQRIVEQHQGQVIVSSKVGLGTKIIVRLPIDADVKTTEAN